MKRMILTLALLVGLAVMGSTMADDLGRASIRTVADEKPAVKADSKASVATGCPHCGSGNTCSAGTGDARIGLLPGIRDIFTKAKGSIRLCRKCGGIFDTNSCPTPAFNPYPNGVPGTLVFPQHPFVRSPRDFFMWEPK